MNSDIITYMYMYNNNYIKEHTQCLKDGRVSQSQAECWFHSTSDTVCEKKGEFVGTSLRVYSWLDEMIKIVCNCLANN